MKSKKRGKPSGALLLTPFAALLFVAMNGTSLAGPYKLGPGDTIEISIGGLPDQRNRTQIQMDGTIPLPGGGTVEVAGLTPAQMQNRIETLLQARILRQRLTDGRDQPFVVKPGEQVRFQAINRAGKLTFPLLVVFGAGPLYVTLKRLV